MSKIKLLPFIAIVLFSLQMVSAQNPDSFVLHAGEIFSVAWNPDGTQIAVKVVNWYACVYKGVCVGEGESYTGDLGPSDWDVIGATLPKFLGGDPRVASSDFGRNWSRADTYAGQFHELAAELYAAWALGYRNEYFDVFPIAETIETIVKEANV